MTTMRNRFIESPLMGGAALTPRRVARRQQNARPDLNGGGQVYRLTITSKNEPKPEL
jgi:hypothetical protein